MRKRRVTLMLDAEVADLLDKLAGTPHKKSAYVSRLLREADAALAVDDPIARLTQRFDAVERQVALLVARLG